MNFNRAASKQARENLLGLSQSQVEGFTQSFISRWEANKVDPIFSTVERLEHFYLSRGVRFGEDGPYLQHPPPPQDKSQIFKILNTEEINITVHGGGGGGSRAGGGS